MQDNLFYDTSVLVYAYDCAEKGKTAICKEYVKNVFAGNTFGIISNQVLAELFNVLTEQISYPLDKEFAESVVNDFILAERWIKLSYDHRTVRKAMATSKKADIPIWDSLIAETMKENSIAEIITENEKDFKKIPGIKVINPFK